MGNNLVLSKRGFFFFVFLVLVLVFWVLFCLRFKKKKSTEIALAELTAEPLSA